MTMVIMPFTKASRDKIKAGTKTATARKTKYGFADDTFMVGGVMYRITEVKKLMLVRVAFDWFKEEGFGSPEEFVEAWVYLHPRIGYTPGRVVFLHLFVKA
jgi:hypothetical protein